MESGFHALARVNVLEDALDPDGLSIPAPPGDAAPDMDPDRGSILAVQTEFRIVDPGIALQERMEDGEDAFPVLGMQVVGPSADATGKLPGAIAQDTVNGGIQLKIAGGDPPIPVPDARAFQHQGQLLLPFPAFPLSLLQLFVLGSQREGLGAHGPSQGRDPGESGDGE